MSRTITILLFILSCGIVSGTAVFIMPHAVDSPYFIQFSLPFLGITVLYFVFSWHFSLWWSLIVGLIIDVFSAPHISLSIVVLSALWLALHGLAQASRGIPYSLHVSVSVLGASVAFSAFLVVQALWQGLFLVSWGGISRIFIDTIIYALMSVGIIGSVRVVSRHMRMYWQIIRTHAPSSRY